MQSNVLNEVVTEILKGFSNRDAAIVLWLGLFGIALLFIKDVRKSALELCRNLFGKYVRGMVAGIIVITSVITAVLSKYDLWDLSLLKVTVVWLLAVITNFLMQVTGVRDVKYFMRAFAKSVKWTVFYSFVVNFYTFSFGAECVLILVLFLFIVIGSFAQQDGRAKSVSVVSNGVVLLVGLLYIGNSLYNILHNTQSIAQLHTVKEALLAPFMTLLFLPFSYLLTMMVNFQTIFYCINCNVGSGDARRILKWNVITVTAFRVSRIVRVVGALNWSKAPTVEQIRTWALDESRDPR